MISLQLQEWTTRRSVSESSEARLDQVFHALSGPARRAILRLLLDEAMCVSDIVDQFRLAQPTISKHLSVLRQAGLVRCERRGQRVFYRTDAAAISEVLMAFLGEHRGPQEGSQRKRTGRPVSAARSFAEKRVRSN